jgi:hypothetical protein
LDPNPAAPNIGAALPISAFDVRARLDGVLVVVLLRGAIA